MSATSKEFFYGESITGSGPIFYLVCQQFDQKKNIHGQSFFVLSGAQLSLWLVVGSRQEASQPSSLLSPPQPVTALLPSPGGGGGGGGGVGANNGLSGGWR